jgi:hypothetical protein
MMNRLPPLQKNEIENRQNYAVSAVMCRQTAGIPSTHILVMNRFSARSPQEAIGMAICVWETTYPGLGYFLRPIAMSI